MRRKIKEDIVWLEFDLLIGLNLKHAVFLKQNGKMIEESSIKNILNLSSVICAKQCHGDKINYIANASDFFEGDGLTTDKLDMALLIKHADCQAGIIYDPQHHAVSNIHVGWRGNVQNLYGKAIEDMILRYGSRPENLLVCISPSLGPLHAEFINYREEFPQHFWKYRVMENNFDLWAVSRMQLENCGILPNHIEIASECTFASQDDFFSYRRDKTVLRHSTLVALT